MLPSLPLRIPNRLWKSWATTFTAATRLLKFGVPISGSSLSPSVKGRVHVMDGYTFWGLLGSIGKGLFSTLLRKKTP